MARSKSTIATSANVLSRRNAVPNGNNKARQKRRGIFAARYLWLAFHIAILDLKKDASTTIAGFLWWILEPVIYMGIFFVLFVIILGVRTENFALFLLVGLLTWRWLQVSILQAGNSIMKNRRLFCQVSIPKFVFPLQTVIANALKFLIAFCTLLAFLIIIGKIHFIGLLYIPILLIVQVFLITALSLIFSAIVPFIPDVYHATSFLFRGLFYLSGILFDISMTPEPYREYLHLNPLASLIQFYRDALLLGKPPDHWVVIAILGLSTIGILLGLLLHARFDNDFVKMHR